MQFLFMKKKTDNNILLSLNSDKLTSKKKKLKKIQKFIRKIIRAIKKLYK